MSKDREDLAKAALIERQKAADMAEGLQRRDRPVIDDTLKSYEADIAKLQGKLREARARQNAIAVRFESAVTRAKAREMLQRQPHRGRLLEFEVLERRADFAEGRADALGMTGPKSLEEEIAELQVVRKGRRRTGSHEGRAEAQGGIRVMEDVLIPLTVVVPILFIGLPWLIFHYVTKWKQAATLTGADEKLLDELHDAGAPARRPAVLDRADHDRREPELAPAVPARRDRAQLADELERSSAAATRSRIGQESNDGYQPPSRTRFYRDKRNGKVMGICAGIADYTGFDVTLVRITHDRRRLPEQRIDPARSISSPAGSRPTKPRELDSSGP